MMLRRRRRLSSACLLIALGVTATGCDAMRKSDFFARHFSDQDQKAAARQRWDSFRGNVRLQMAEQHLKSGRYDEAEKVLAEAREMAADEPAVLLLSAELHFATGELTRARNEIEEYMAMVPDDVKGRSLGGGIALRAGRIDDAIMWYRSAVELAPDDAEYRQKLAECLMARGKSAEALSVIELSTDFESSIGLRQLAMEICDTRGDVDGAVRHARAVAQMAGDNADVLERAGIVLAASGAFEDAVRVLGPIVDRHVTERRTHTLDANDVEPARPVEAIHAYARSCLEINHDDAAMRVLKVAIREDPADQVTWSLYCRGAIRAGNLAMALEIVSTFNRRNDPIPEMIVLEAYVHFLRGELAEAREAADRALKVDPAFEPAVILKAQAIRIDTKPRVPERARLRPYRSVATALIDRRRAFELRDSAEAPESGQPRTLDAVSGAEFAGVQEECWP